MLAEGGEVCRFAQAPVADDREDEWGTKIFMIMRRRAMPAAI